MAVRFAKTTRSCFLCNYKTSIDLDEKRTKFMGSNHLYREGDTNVFYTKTKIYKMFPRMKNF